MKWIEVDSSGPLKGKVVIPGSKNSSLALLAAACLADEPVRLQGLPNILDIRVIERICADIGVTMIWEENGDVVVDSRKAVSADLDPAKSSAYRASYYFVGAMLAKHHQVCIGYPGGDDFVSRPIDQHYKTFRALGASIELHEQYYLVKAKRLTGAEIFFDMITSGATINAMLAGALAEGITVLRNAATDPEVVDTANLLNAMGAKVRGAGTSTIRIEGVQSLQGCTYQVIPDRLIAGAFLMAAGATNGCVTVEGIIPEHLSSCMVKLKETGMEFTVGDNCITAYGSDKLRAVRVRTGMYPAFATDLQQPLTPLLMQANGKSIITDKVYPKRFAHIHQLKRMGADIEVRGSSAFIQGKKPLKGAWVHASDVRAGVCLLLAALTAEGVTYIAGVEHIERGYANVTEAFQSLGARMKLVQNSDMNAQELQARLNG